MNPTPAANRRRRLLRPCLAVGLLLSGSVLAQAPPRPVVKIEEGKTDVSEPVGVVDPQVHIAYRYRPDMNFGLMVDGQRITYGPDGNTNTLMVRIDNQDMLYGNNGQFLERGVPLTGGPFGRKRQGTKSTWVVGKVHITQVLEIVPSKLPPKAAPGQKRRLDTVLVRYLVDNKDTQPHTVGIRPMIDMLVVNNDGALFASPTTHPNQILNGVELKDKAVPAYLQVLQNNNLQNPGFVAHFTFKIGGKLIGPDRVVMTNLGAGAGWDIPAIQAGDSAIAFYFSPRQVQPGAKVEFAYAHGQGIASNPENEGKVTLAFGGSFEPNKLFTVTAYVDDPTESQSLTLELPPGMEYVEGKEVQPVPAAADTGRSIVFWKARVTRPGDYALKLRSSNGVTQTRRITVTPTAGGRD